MRHASTALLLAVLAAGPSRADPLPLTVPQLDAVCRSATMAEAAGHGDASGWRRLSGPRLDAWRASFVAVNGGTVQLLTWGRGQEEGDGLLSFWIARGGADHRACTYSSSGSSGLLDGLTAHLGPPRDLARSEYGVQAFWKLGATEVSFSQVGTATLVRYTRPGTAR